MPGVKKFNPEKDMPSLAGKVIFITGAGLGAQSVKELAKHNPIHIYFSGRNVQKGEALITEIKTATPDASLTFIKIDMSSSSSIKSAMEQFRHDRLDIFMGNAGGMLPPGLSEDGHEITFATNHLGHALILKHLLPTLLHTASFPSSDVRIILSTSVAWMFHPPRGIQFSTLQTPQSHLLFGTWLRYAQSKLANLIYARLLSVKYPQINSVSVHPGIIDTGFVTGQRWWDRWFVYITTVGRMVSVEEGAWNQLFVATTVEKAGLRNGGFYMPVGVWSDGVLDGVAKSEELAEQLWEWTEKAMEGF